MSAERVGSGEIGSTGFNASEPEQVPGDPDLGLRVGRLETVVSGLALVLERLESGGEPLDGMALEDFDDPAASNEALDLVFQSFSDARRDLAALRHAMPVLAAAPFSSPQRTVLVGVEERARSAARLADAFEAYRRSIDQRVPPRTPGGIARLDEFLGMIVRALRDVAAVVDQAPGAQAAPSSAMPRPAPVLPPLEVVLAATAPAPPPPPLVPAVTLEPTVAPSASLTALPPIDASTVATQPSVMPGSPPTVSRGRGSLGAWLWRHVQRRRTRLVVESAAVVVVALVILVSAMHPGAVPSGAFGATSSPSGSPGSTLGAPVAVGGGSSPGVSASPGRPTPVGQTAAPAGPGATSQPQGSAPPAPTPPRPTPQPTQQTSPTADPGIPAGQFADRIAAAADQIDGYLATITTAVKGADFQGAHSAAVSMAGVSSTERTWLLAHPPASCYAFSYDTAMTRYGDLLATATSIETAADAADANAIHQDVGSAHGDVSALKQAANKAVTACA
jgi:hypothetical protein